MKDIVHVLSTEDFGFESFVPEFIEREDYLEAVRRFMSSYGRLRGKDHCNQIAGYICITIGYNQLFNQNAKSSHTDTCSTNLLTNSLIFINIHRNTLYITNHITIILIHTTSYIRVFFMLLANLEIAYRGIVFFVVQLRYVCFLCFWLISIRCFSTKHITNNVL